MKQYKKAIKESTNHRVSAARLEGKAHGLKGHAYCGKNYDDREHVRAYHEGYLDGLNEANGMGIYEETLVSPGAAPAVPPATVPGMAQQSMPKEGALGTIGGAVVGGALGGPTGAAIGSTVGQEMSKGGSSLFDDSPSFAFEDWDKQLNTLLNEGVTITVSKGNEGASDSVNISATDADSNAILELVKNSGIGGVFGTSAPSANPEVGGTETTISQPTQHGGIEVVGDNEGMLGIMKKLSGIEKGAAPQASGDFADEEGSGEATLNGEPRSEAPQNESSCGSCGGAMSEGHQCGGDQPIQEVETEDQMEFNVAENNAEDDATLASFRQIGAGSQPPSSPEVSADVEIDAPATGGDIDQKALSDKIAQFLLSLDAVAADKGIDTETEVDVEVDSEPKSEPKADSDEGDDSEESDTEEKEEPVEEDNAPDSDEAETSADEESEAAEDEALAQKSLAEAKSKKPKFDDSNFDEKGNPKKRKEKYDATNFDEKGKPKKETQVKEWANDAGKKGTDASFEQTTEFMTKTISGGLNKPKSTGQTTVPVIASQTERTFDGERTDALNEWLQLAGIKK